MSVRGGNRLPQVKPYEPSARDLQMYELVVSGAASKAEIGKRFKLSGQRVGQICRQVDTWLAPQIMDHIRSLKARQTASLEHTFREAMQAWERSKRDAESETVRDGTGGVETTRTTKGQVGNPAFLAEARAALTDIRKIWGAESPVAQDSESGVRYAGLSRDERRRVYAEQQVAKYSQWIAPGEN